MIDTGFTESMKHCSVKNEEVINTGYALIAAMECGNVSDVGKFILREAANIDIALEESRRLKNDVVTATLLLIKAAMENDRILVLKLYGEDVQGLNSKILLTEEDNITKLQHVVCNHTVTTVWPIKISRLCGASAVTEELLLRTNVDKKSGNVVWSDLLLTQLEMIWLQYIHWVTMLSLAHNELITLPLEMGTCLRQCTMLDLQSNKLCNIPHCILQLPILNELNLSHNHIVEVPDVPEWSASLRVLDLSYNYLRNLPDFVVAPNLVNLNISNNQFCTVPYCVCSFIGLTTLNIAYNSQILTLPTELGQLKNLLNLNLHGLYLYDPPRSDCFTTADCIHYLNSRLSNDNGYYHMKLMLLGNQGVGKSTIIARLLGQEIDSKFTGSVDIIEWKYAPAYSSKMFHFTIWDFADQNECYATYQYFLTKCSLYLLVWNITKGDDGIAGLKPWLNIISARVPHSCVIIVGTFFDKISEEDSQSGKVDDLPNKVGELTSQYKHLVVTYITVVGLQGQMENIAMLKDFIYNAALKYTIKTSTKRPSSYYTLAAKLIALRSKVRNGEHEPIMHVDEFKKMVKDLNLVGLQDDEKIHTATDFLHDCGVLLHYGDRDCGLGDLYFVDPAWLCNLIFNVVAIKQQNPYFKKQGMICAIDIPNLLNFPTQYLHAILTILKNFGIAFPIDKDNRNILIPSILPEDCPAIVRKQLSDNTDGYKRFIKFVSRDQTNHHLTSQGLWSHLLSRIMVSIKEIRDNLNVPISVMGNNLAISANVHLESKTTIFTEEEPKATVKCIHSDVAPVSGTSNQSFNQSSKKFLEYDGSVAISDPAATIRPQLEYKDLLSVNSCEDLVYWCTGIFYNVNNLFIIIASLEQIVKDQDRNGIFIMCSPTDVGCRVFGQIIDLVEQLISEWYPELAGELDHTVPCYECVKADTPIPYEFKVYQLLLLIADHKLSTKCGACHKVQKIKNLAPDLLLTEPNEPLFLYASETIYKENQHGVLETGAFGEICHGKYKGQSVAVRLYSEKERSKVEKYLKELRSEGKVFHQSYHPCLVHVVAIIIQPTISLVLEDAPQGTLQVPLLSEQFAFSRIMIYRIAIQVASALQYLHSSNISFHDLRASNVLLWSLSLDHLVNCKVTVVTISTYADPRGLYNAQGFIAPEVAHTNHSKVHSAVYDHRADIFSFGMFLYQLIARRHPFHNVPPFKIKAAIEDGWRPQLEDIPVAETGLFYMTRIMKLCWTGSADTRPKIQKIVEWLSTPVLQLIISVIPVNSQKSISNGCIVTTLHRNQDKPVSEVWIYCDGDEGTEISIFNPNSLLKVEKKLVYKNRVCCIKQCGDQIWETTRGGVLNILHKNSKDRVDSMKIRDHTVTCITSFDQRVCMGTMEGYCFTSPICMNGQSVESKAQYKHVAERCIDGVVLTQAHLWVSSYNQIYFWNPNTLEVEGVEKRTKNKHACVGKMMLCDNGDEVWSAHLGGVIMSSWSVHQRVHLCDVDVGVIAKEKCHVGDPRDQIITAMCTGLDTVWIGLTSGHIIVFGMNPPGEVLTYFRPYHSYVRFLSAANCPGPCGKEECLMLSGGKMYQPADSFKELFEYPHKNKSSQPVDNAGVAILWEVLPAKYVRQVHYLRDGKAWLNYDRLRMAMEDTGFTDSLKYCKSSAGTVPTQNDALDNGTIDHQQDVKEHNVDTLHDDATVSTALIHNDVSSLSEQLSVNLPTGEQLTLVCKQPITINSLINKLTMVTEMMGNMLITYQVDGEDVVTVKNNEQLEQYLRLSDRPNLHAEII
ncbi:leucine-rich repeat serine/threonine-protein kinase 2-like [Dysidea avara]|uniref:leucine-rich repeat serine/threonine-protein kinase 2-like n=1 Tax=Dysidea avara TaxID=196820 RepID=UPI0033327B27